MTSILRRPSLTTAILAAFAVGLLPHASSPQEPRVQWTATTEDLNVTGQALLLEDSVHVLQLRAGWSCTIGATSKHPPLYEARTTTCRKGEEAFEFTVQCERLRPKDHIQIRFAGPPGKFADFIEVSCELRN